MMGKQAVTFFIVMFVVLSALIFALSTEPRLGLDLKGGTQVTLQALPTEDVPTITPEVIAGVQAVIQQRINGLGVAESLVQISGSDQIFVQLPGVSDPDRALELLGDTARLEFREQRIATQIPRDELGELKTSGDDVEAIFDKVGLTGELLRRAEPAPLQNGSWQIAIEFKGKGSDLFAQLTKDLAGTGRAIGIFLDDTLISAPIVGPEFAKAGIVGGRAVITGSFTIEEATDLAIKLQAGALPVPIEILENRTVGATLGSESVQRSLYAGIAGLILVFIYMLAYYKLPGLIADIALLFYAICSFAVFQYVGVTLTLPGIAGFILSIGMAVDANVLIFERIREELREGKSLYKSVDEGFSRAFSSIFDGNITTLLVCTVLFVLGVGLVKGFAVTLGIGVTVSFFSALTCTRTMLFLAMGIPSLRRPELFGVSELAKS